LWLAEIDFIYRRTEVSDTANKKMYWFLRAEAAVLFCLICIWIVKLATVDINSTEAAVPGQVVAGQDSANADILIGQAYRSSDHAEEAIQNYKEAIRTNPNDFDAYFDLGGCYSSLGRNEESMEANKQAVRIRPDYAFAHIALGLDYYNLGRYQEAIETYNHAIQIDSSVANAAHLLIGHAYTASSRQ
jgi:tetratricopeptide (TPR) repeat protein